MHCTMFIVASSAACPTESGSAVVPVKWNHRPRYARQPGQLSWRRPCCASLARCACPAVDVWQPVLQPSALRTTTRSPHNLLTLFSGAGRTRSGAQGACTAASNSHRLPCVAPTRIRRLWRRTAGCPRCEGVENVFRLNRTRCLAAARCGCMQLHAHGRHASTTLWDLSDRCQGRNSASGMPNGQLVAGCGACRLTASRPTSTHRVVSRSQSIGDHRCRLAGTCLSHLNVCTRRVS